jgi:predicted RNA polymerase sigma factor
VARTDHPRGGRWRYGYNLQPGFRIARSSTAAGADLLRRLGRSGGAVGEYRRVLGLIGNSIERAFLARRREQMATPPR